MIDVGHTIVVPSGVRGFDTAERLTPRVMQLFFDAGYRYAVRYVRREPAHPADLSVSEAAALLEARLGLMVVQHVESETAWIPNANKGSGNGKVAADEAMRIGIPAGVTVWCDLEGVVPGTPAKDVIEYGNNWHRAVAAEGFVPGLYVGWHSGLTARQLYTELRFAHYWAAYNLNSDEEPAVRGVQMKQCAAKQADRPAGVTLDFDTDRVRTDANGGLPTVVAPEDWLEHA